MNLNVGEALDRSISGWKRWLKPNGRDATSTPRSASTSEDNQSSVSTFDQIESEHEIPRPLKSAISQLQSLMNAFENLSEDQTNYVELRFKINKVLRDISKYVLKPTNSSAATTLRVLEQIERELRTMDEACVRGTGRYRYDELMKIKAVITCGRHVADYIQQLIFSLSLSIASDVGDQMVLFRLNKMIPSMAATYNSAESINTQRGSCTPGTRQLPIDRLLQWARSSDANKIFWLSGMAGTGKTTITYTVCSELDSAGQLAANFFCSRMIPECRRVQHIIPSIAYQFARFSLPFRRCIAKTLETDPDAHTRALDLQYHKLMVEPLAQMKDSLLADFIVVIDALDECDNLSGIRQLLDLLLSTPDRIPVRYLISSRPEIQVTRRLPEQLCDQTSTLLALHHLDPVIVRGDVEIYMRHKLKDVPLTDSQWEDILRQCGDLFAYASTVYHFIVEAHESMLLDDAIRTLSSSTAILMKSGSSMGTLYSRILEDAFDALKFSEERIRKMKNILEMVICAIVPMSTGTIATLLGLKDEKEVNIILQPFLSVVTIEEKTGLVMVMHSSFRDFMVAPDVSLRFFRDQAVKNASMAKACLRIIDHAEPKFNICALSSSYLLDSEVSDLKNRISESITPALIYSCYYWSTHLTLAGQCDELINHVQCFLASRLLLWMEVMNLTNSMHYGIKVIMSVEKWCRQRSVPADVTELAYDAWQFVSTYANHVVSQSTPHIYVSMLPFWPRNTPISAAYMPRTSHLAYPNGDAINRRRLLRIAVRRASIMAMGSITLSADGARVVLPARDGLEVIDLFTNEMVSRLAETRAKGALFVTMSPDCTQVVFAQQSGTAYLWDLANEGIVTKLFSNPISGVLSAAFSFDGSRVACGLSNGDVYIRGLPSKPCVIGPLSWDGNQINCVSFSPDGLHLASGTAGATVQVWIVRIGQLLRQPFKGHTNSVRSVSYSPDGLRLASAANDKTIRIWDPQTGRTTLGPLTGHTDDILSVAFSPNGAFIASGSADNSLILYDAYTGQALIGPLREHTSPVTSVLFSQDSNKLFSCSDDFTVNIWSILNRNASDPQTLASIPSHPIYSMQQSPCGSRIVSGSSNGDILIWDVQTGDMVLGLVYGHHGSIWAVDYSPNGAYVVGTRSNTLSIWDAWTGNDLHGLMYGHQRTVRCVRFAEDNLQLVSGSDDGTVRMWDITTGQTVFQLLFEQDAQISSVAVSPTGRHIASGSGNGRLRVLDRQTGQTVIGPLQGHLERVTSIEFCANNLILSGSHDGSIRIWHNVKNRMTAFAEYTLGYRSWICSAAFSPNGEYVVSSSLDGNIQIRSVHNTTLAPSLIIGHNKQVRQVQFSPDGTQIVSCSDDCTIRFWNITNTMAGVTADIEHSGNAESLIGQCQPYVSWVLDRDSWVVDSQNQKILWVPVDLRGRLAIPPNEVIIGGQYFKLELKGVKVGESWIDCYRP